MCVSENNFSICVVAQLAKNDFTDEHVALFFYASYLIKIYCKKYIKPRNQNSALIIISILNIQGKMLSTKPTKV